jgi:hypothetical protein
MQRLEELRGWLREDDARSRPYRADRLGVLLDELNSERMFTFHGGAMAFMAFEEARRAFVYGLFGAVTILVQVCMEHTLGGLFAMAGRDDVARAPFETLLLEAQRGGYLNANEFATFDKLRTIRNTYTHWRPVLSKNALQLRAIESDRETDELMAGDAKAAIMSLLQFLSRFSVPIDSVPPED